MVIGKAGAELTHTFGRQSVYLFEVKSEENICNQLDEAINQICTCNSGINSSPV